MYRFKLQSLGNIIYVRRKTFYYVVSIIVFISSFFYSLMVNSIHISYMTVIHILQDQIFRSGYYIPTKTYEIITILKEPEVIGAAAVGASLAVGGAVVQSIFRNPISEPYIIGISGGATLGAVIAIVFGEYIFGAFSLQMFAFIFSLITVGMVYIASMRSGRAPPTVMLLTGIAISLFVTSIVALLLYSNPNYENEVFYWLLGSLQGISWQEDEVIVPLVFFTSIIFMYMYRELNALQMGDVYAKSIGINTERTKALFLILTTVSVSAVVSISGLIGFVGLIFPHVSRLIFGGSNKHVLPASAILGASFLMLANDAAHLVIIGEVIPIGIITGIVGVPVFMALMIKTSKNGYYAS